MVLGMSALHAEPTCAPARGPGLPAAEPAEPTSCEDCGDVLGENARAGRCGSCNTRARHKFYAARYAADARPGLVVDEKITEVFAWFLPAALARKGLALERVGVDWVVRSAS